MASGDTLAYFHPDHNEPPSSNYALRDIRNGHPVLNFDASTQWGAIFSDWIAANYGAATGITVVVYWVAATAITGGVTFQASFELMNAATDEDADSFASAQAATTTAPGTSGAPAATSIAFTAGAQVDSVVANSQFRLKVERVVADAGDTMAGYAQITGVLVKET